MGYKSAILSSTRRPQRGIRGLGAEVPRAHHEPARRAFDPPRCNGRHAEYVLLIIKCSEHNGRPLVALIAEHNGGDVKKSVENKKSVEKQRFLNGVPITAWLIMFVYS